MAEITYWGGTITGAALAHDATWGGTLVATNPDYVPFEGTIDGDDAKINALLAAHRVIGWEVQLDLGSGFEVIPPADYRLGTIHESIREWSATASIELVGERYNPLVYAIFRGFVPITISMIFGEPSAPFTVERFAGSLVAGPWDPVTRTLSATAMDDGAKYAETMVALNIEADDGKARDEVLAIDLLEANGITIGDRFELGVNGSKLIKKPYSQVDQRLLDLVLDWIAPCGAWIYWRDGEAQVSRYSTDRPAARRLSPRDVISIGPLQGPPAPTPNKVTVVCVDYDVTNESGVRTVAFEELVYENYARKGAVKKQDKTTGVLTSVSYSDAAPSNRLVTRIRYVQSFIGDFLQRSDVIEYGWYAQQTARLQVETDGTTVNHLSDYDCYQFADGTWRKDPVETFRAISHSTSEKLVANNAVTETWERRYFYHFRARAIFELTGAGPVETFADAGAIALTESSEGVDPSWESASPVLGHLDWASVPDEETVHQYFADSAGYLVREVETTYRYARGAKATARRSGSFVYGLEASQKEYWSAETEDLIAVAETTTVYQPVGTDSYTVAVRLKELATNKLTLKPTETRSGARPRPEEIIPQSRSRETRSSVEDVVRSALNGVREDVIVNEYCQDAEDSNELGKAELRDLSSWPVPLVMPIDHALRSDSYVILEDGFGDGTSGMRFLVESVDLDPPSFTMSAALRWIPPEVSDAE